jgi:hypothetical protein
MSSLIGSACCIQLCPEHEVFQSNVQPVMFDGCADMKHFIIFMLIVFFQDVMRHGNDMSDPSIFHGDNVVLVCDNQIQVCPWESQLL